MKFHRFRRGLTMALALVLVLSLVPVSAIAAETDGLCEHHTAHDDQCGYAPAVEASACTHACTESPECFGTECAHVHEITCYNTDGDLSCRHVCTDSPACSEVVHNCVHEHDGECGYREAQEETPCTFFVNGCDECKAEAEKPEFTLIELVATDVTLDETQFTYTGEEIRPNVTVRVQGQLLTLDKDYTLEYADNIEPGTAKVIVTGIATASQTLGYTGTVEHPFFIAAAQEPEAPEVTDPTEPEMPEETDPTEPETPEETDPTEPEVPEETDPTEPEVPEETDPTEPEVPEETDPTEPEVPEETDPTEPETPEETDPTEPETPEESEPEKVTYKITAGSGASWYRASGKALSFTADGKYADFTGVSVDGKTLDEKYFLVKEGSTVVSLTSTFLEKLSLGKHTITVHFTDGDAEGTFTVANPTDDENPKTGDAFNLHLWSAVLFMSLTGLAGAAFVYVRKRK